MIKKIDKLKKLLEEETSKKPWQDLVTPWEEATPWEELAKSRIQRYTKAGLALLRGTPSRRDFSEGIG